MADKKLYILYVLCLVAPLLITSLYVYNYFQNNIWGFSPAWSDEIVYWSEINSFVKVFFENGHFSIDEQVKPTFSHYGAHGPFYPILLGMFSKVFGYGINSGVFYNLVFIFLATILFLFVIKPNLFDTVSLLGVLCLFWPMYLYIPTAMQECLHYSIAITMSVFLYKLFKNPENKKIKMWLLLIITIASVIRPTWSFLIPFFFMPLELKKYKDFCFKTIISIIYIFSLFMLSNYLSAPYPNWVSQWIQGGFHLNLLIQHFVLNIQGFFSGQGSTLEWIQRLVCILILFIYGSSALLYIFRIKKIDFGVSSFESTNISFKLFYFHLANLGMVILLTLLVYDIGDWRDFRVIAPHLLLSVLLEVCFRKKLVPILLICSNITFLSAFSNVYQSLHKVHFAKQESSSPWSVLDELIHYDNNAGPWGNTLLIDTNHINSNLLYVPHGIGISFIINHTSLGEKILSKYILVNDEVYNKISTKGNFKLIASFPDARLYINQY
ncbi:hypothetical protein SAMN03159341_11788 [Paenibacillus sp. 1_12]|uniref:hypothetical protein n=1 Tax=Paenibacillus sp. 1_12 TaxID=1566278 RepID=UPI0008F28BB9|nr:hypothetical protein [Paenibacillus sp. 1_12]SFM13122.1 hypothetical protein SAMN03159341_11788 [Paenibacillus sp. 1_12]